MNRQTIKFLFWVVIVYLAILLVTRGIVPDNSTPTISITAVPLIIMAIVLIRDLTRRAVQPEDSRKIVPSQTRTGNDLKFLTRQIEATFGASESYFVDIVMTRLKELLVTKASLETGVQIDSVRRILSDSIHGPEFLGNRVLYKLLYSEAPRIGKSRIYMIQKTVELIENWKA